MNFGRFTSVASKNLVGTRLGNAYLYFKGWSSLRRLPYANPEQAATVANSILADRLIARLCPKGGTFLDIGVHVGSVMASVHSHDPSVKILGIEADHEKSDHLRKQFPYCELFELALGEKEGIAEFYTNPQATGYNSLAALDMDDVVVTKVRVAALDDILPDQNVDLIKIDIEGAELGAMRGATKLIARSRPVIMFECVGTEVNSLGFSAAQLWSWFDENDYMLFAPNRLAHDAGPLGQESFLSGNEYPFDTHNYFAVPAEKRIEVRDRARKILAIKA